MWEFLWTSQNRNCIRQHPFKITSHLESILYNVKIKQVSFINQSETKTTFVLPKLTWKKDHCYKDPKTISKLLSVAQTGKKNKIKREN